jgi:hypothetical protein
MQIQSGTTRNWNDVFCEDVKLVEKINNNNNKPWTSSSVDWSIQRIETNENGFGIEDA